MIRQPQTPPPASAAGLPPREGEGRTLLISRHTRRRYHLDADLFSLSGKVVFADLAAARRLAAALAGRGVDGAGPALATVTPGQLFALGLIHELIHHTLDRYRRRVDPEVLTRALGRLGERLGGQRLDGALTAFVETFPPPAVWRGELAAADYVTGTTEGRPNREVALEEMLILWLANAAPAFAPFRELFDDGELRRSTAYPELMAGLAELLAGRPGLPGGEEGEEGDKEAGAGAAREAGRGAGAVESLYDSLHRPLVEGPRGLAELLAFLLRRWGGGRGPIGLKVLRGTDLLREEERPVFPPGPGPLPVARFSGAGEEPEGFSPDLDWMPRLVLLAKNVNVWLHQLARAWGRPIRRLDEIPDGELDTLAARGVTGLWLIGLWERSPASRRIKQLCGNPEADASAYSLAGYTIAAELGGEEALADLSRRARRRGIRLAADMVPNHFGIDSPWVLEHPERFIQVPEPPFPSYGFSGPDLSPDPRVALRIEDHYYDRSDAAVVFQRVDRATGRATYIYHGNDGTSTPWNDTAQLDYLEAEVREAVIQTILGVARRFSIIRFDAAMTLARRHVQRLWYPPPGEGGAIPSRAEHGLSEEELDAAMPEEFWRQVVDRVAEEVPDTLLLAEAFWLMESYFVRTLGMHRVYNSAFMVMLRDERNADYREQLRNVLAFEPEILKRYVNFMSNPDERTAVDQFGKGDKYFGICTLLATLPGLPMLGHGQVEGFTEKYGMEYTRAYHDEEPDPWLVARHERQIFPLLRRRYLFAGSASFFLFDFETAPGQVDENVFAFSNRCGEERALVVFHNRGATTSGRIRRSVPFAVRSAPGAKPHLKWETLGHALGVDGRAAPWVRCRDQATGLEHLFEVDELAGEGLSLTLGPYQCHAFLNFQPVAAYAPGPWAELAHHLGGRGVASLDEALLELRLEPVLAAFSQLVNARAVGRFQEGLPGAGLAAAASEALEPDEPEEMEARLRSLFDALRASVELPTPGPAPAPTLAQGPGAGEDPGDGRGGTGGEGEGRDAALATAIRRDLETARTALAEVMAATTEAARDAPTSEGTESEPGSAEPAAAPLDTSPETSPGNSPGNSPKAPLEPSPEASAAPYLAGPLTDDPPTWGTLYAWLLCRRLGELAGTADAAASGTETSRAWLDELLLAHRVAPALRELGAEEERTHQEVLVLKVLVAGHRPPLVALAQGVGAVDLAAWLADPDVRLCLHLNTWEGTLYFRREPFESLLWWGVLATALEHGTQAPETAAAHQAAHALARAGERAGYRLEELLAAYRGEAIPPPA